MQNQDKDSSEALREQVLLAYQQDQPLNIQGGQSKTWYGGLAQGKVLSTTDHSGVISYEATELVITARSGTPLAVIEDVLAQQNQYLPFEPPAFGANATIGGTIAGNFSGPSRPYTGSARDFVLGCRIINGRGELLKFGGQVMKNVAGYDVSRLMAGALGTLGVLMEISLKVLPRPATTLSLVQRMDAHAALKYLRKLALLPLPITGAVWYDGYLYLRLAGSAGALKQSQTNLTGDVISSAESEAFWQQVREHTHPFFQPALAEKLNVWRLSLPVDTPVLSDLPSDCLYDWGGAQRWLCLEPAEQALQQIRTVVNAVGGHATLFRSADDDWRVRARGLVFEPLASTLLAYERQLKHAFDPKGILNPNRLYNRF